MRRWCLRRALPYPPPWPQGKVPRDKWFAYRPQSGVPAWIPVLHQRRARVSNDKRTQGTGAKLIFRTSSVDSCAFCHSGVKGRGSR